MASSPAGLESPMNSSSSPSKLAGMGSDTPPESQGESAAGGEGQTGATAQTSMLRQSIQKLRSMEMDLQSMTEQFPSAAPAIRQATKPD